MESKEKESCTGCLGKTVHHVCGEQPDASEKVETPPPITISVRGIGSSITFGIEKK